ncbi:hypothetical protein B5X24_HaOG203163 [Helicoverpa armigera]|uniref:Uncharacterized protein n=1 Tax=Helicoverpa armigera TaxID=29058 RepID=A0A2W1BWN4_HELAM|nr:hypothetical protein B5X24_HaOG203163 [Helicoverpa armigera]
MEPLQLSSGELLNPEQLGVWSQKDKFNLCLALLKTGTKDLDTVSAFLWEHTECTKTRVQINAAIENFTQIANDIFYQMQN